MCNFDGLWYLWCTYLTSSATMRFTWVVINQRFQQQFDRLSWYGARSRCPAYDFNRPLWSLQQHSQVYCCSWNDLVSATINKNSTFVKVPSSNSISHLCHFNIFVFWNRWRRQLMASVWASAFTNLYFSSFLMFQRTNGDKSNKHQITVMWKSQHIHFQFSGFPYQGALNKIIRSLTDL